MAGAEASSRCPGLLPPLCAGFLTPHTTGQQTAGLVFFVLHDSMGSMWCETFDPALWLSR